MGEVGTQRVGHGRPDDKGDLRAKEARGTARRLRVQRVCPSGDMSVMPSPTQWKP